MVKTISRRWKVAGASALALAVFLAIHPEVLLILAIFTSERRPDLLADARRDDPASALAFNRAFQRGASQTSLFEWLVDNRFSIDARGHTASKHIRSLPCNETVRVSWAPDLDQSRLAVARAVVTETGCL